MSDEQLRVDHPLVHSPGVFFGLPEEEYHNALALSSGGVKQLRMSALAWWVNSPLNPDRPAEDDKETDAQRIGKAYHTRIVEGRKAFVQRYAAALDPADYANALRTNGDLADRIVQLGGKPKSSARKAELIEHLLAIQPMAQIWDMIVHDHAELHKGKILLDAPLVKRIENAAAMIESHTELGKAFSGGMPEVSVFWFDESGVPCKVRFDYLKTRAIIDLKTFELRDVPPDRAIARAVASYRYHIQAAFYLRGAWELPKLIRASQVHGNCDLRFVDQLLHDDDPKTFLFIFQAKGLAPLVKGKILPPGIVMDLGNNAIEEALAKWAHGWRTWRLDPWIEPTEIGTFEDHEFPPWIAD
jgi:hypothetical protein